MLPPWRSCCRGATDRSSPVPRSREGPGFGRPDDVNGTMVGIDPAGEIGAIMTAPRREIDSNCLDPARQPRGLTNAIRYVVDGGTSPLQAGQTGYYVIIQSRSMARSAHGIRPRAPGGYRAARCWQVTRAEALGLPLMQMRLSLQFGDTPRRGGINRQSSFARSAGWIVAEYASQKAWPAFLTVGAEEAGSTPARGQAIIW